MSTSPSENRPSLLPRFIGRVLLGVGVGIAGGFLMRQMQEADSGQSYHGLIAAGIVCAIIGFVIVRKTRGTR